MSLCNAAALVERSGARGGRRDRRGFIRGGAASRGRKASAYLLIHALLCASFNVSKVTTK